MRKYLLHVLIISFVFLLALLASPLHAQQTTTVTRIVDGDTLKVFYLEGEESIRLIGIDTPESRVNKKTKKDAKRSGQDIERFAKLSVVANFQPLWAYTDDYITDLTAPFLGDKRMRWMYPIRSIQKSGGMIAFG